MNEHHNPEVPATLVPSDASDIASLQSQLQAAQVLSVQTSALNRITMLLNSTSDLEMMLEYLASSIHWLFDVDVCGIFLADKYDHLSLRILVPYHAQILSVLPDSDLDSFVRYPRIQDSREPHILAMLEECFMSGQSIGSQQALCIPLNAGDQFLGTFICATNQTHGYSAADVHIAYLFGSQLTAAIQRGLVTLQFQHDHSSIMTLYQMLEDLSQLSSVQALLKQITRIGVLITGAERGTLLALDPQSREPQAMLTWPQDPPELALLELVNTGCFPTVLATGKPHKLDLALQDHTWSGSIESEQATTSVLCVPLGHQSRLNGVLQLTHNEAAVFEDDHVSLLATLAQQVSIMLENVRYAEQQKQLFQQYVGSNVADHLLMHPELSSLGGKRELVTVFFADIQGFTSFSEQYEPEELITILNSYLGIIADAIQEFGGTLDKFMGDAVLAFFNAPIKQSDHVLRAAQAALRVQRLIQGYHRLIHGQEHLHFRIGIHTGEAVVGNIGTENMRNYTVIGDVVNTAKRVQEAADPGRILVSETYKELLGPNGVTEFAGQMELKGKSDSQALYWLHSCCQD